MVDYARWKVVAWRFVRVFFGAFLVEAGLNWQQVVVPQDVLKLVLIPAVVAGVVAGFKAVREYLASGNYRSLLHKLPL